MVHKQPLCYFQFRHGLCAFFCIVKWLIHVFPLHISEVEIVSFVVFFQILKEARKCLPMSILNKLMSLKMCCGISRNISQNDPLSRDNPCSCKSCKAQISANTKKIKYSRTTTSILDCLISEEKCNNTVGMCDKEPLFIHRMWIYQNW